MEARLLLLLWKSSSECMPINDDSRVEGDHFLGGAREGVQIKAFSSERKKLMNAFYVYVLSWNFGVRIKNAVEKENPFTHSL